MPWKRSLVQTCSICTQPASAFLKGISRSRQAMITEERVTSKHEQMASKRPLTVSVSELWDYLQIPKSTSRIRTSTSKHSICERIQITTYYHTDRALQLRSRLTVLTVQYNAADRAMNEKNNEKKKKPSRCEGWMAHFSQPSPTTSCTFPIDL